MTPDAILLTLAAAIVVAAMVSLTCFSNQCRRCGRPVESGEVCGPCQAVERSEGE